MKKLIVVFLSIFMVSSFAFGQTNQTKPSWAANPIHLEGKSSKLMTISDYGSTKDDARARAFKSLEDGGRKLNEGYRIIEEFWEFKGNWAYGYFLVQVSNELKCTNWERIELSTTKYPFSARCFVPGMAQFYKGSMVKGGLIIGGEVVGVAGIVTCFSMKGSYEKLMVEDPKHKATYSQNADMWQNIGIGCIAFTAAVYVYNVIDGAIASGKPHIQIGSKSYDLAFAPVATPRGDIGLAMQVKF